MSSQMISGWISYKVHYTASVPLAWKKQTPFRRPGSPILAVPVAEPYVNYIETPLKNVLWWAPYAFCGLLIVVGIAVLLVLTR
jgi:hypothetical protein